MNTEVKADHHGPAAGQPPHRGKRRHKAWLVLKVFVLLMILCLVGGAVAYHVICLAPKSSEPYRLALQQAQKDQRLIAEIGEPIREEPWWFPVLGRIAAQGEEGTAHLEFQVAGPKGKATIHVDAERKGGQWRLKQLTGTPKAEGGRLFPLDKGDASGLEEAPKFVQPGGKPKAKEKERQGEPSPKDIKIEVPEGPFP